MAAGRAKRSTPVAVAALAVLLAGCSGTPLGDRLAGSFSAAPAPQAPPASPAQPPAAGKPADAGQATAQTNAKADANAGGAGADGGRKPPAAGPAKPLPPAPYRITIKLPSADPSAPAELVTEALRQAGVPFEVEMIERVNSGPPPAAPLQAPAPAPAPRPR